MSDLNRNASIIALRKDGIGPREIARRMRVSPGVVAGVLDRAGLVAAGSNGYASDDMTCRVLKEISSGLSVTAAAARWNLPRTTVQSWVRKTLRKKA